MRVRAQVYFISNLYYITCQDSRRYLVSVSVCGRGGGGGGGGGGCEQEWCYKG